MPRDMFQKRKSDVLSKRDKSFAGKWDEKIKPLCEKINSSENYYTTSSCSGRVVVMIDQEKKGTDLFIKIWHDNFSFGDLKNEIKKIKTKRQVKFKMESCALNVACRDLESARELCEAARRAGWKRFGIMLSDKRIMVSLNSTEKMEFPLFEKRELLVGDDFLKLVVKQSNEKLRRGWKKIEGLKKNV